MNSRICGMGILPMNPLAETPLPVFGEALRVRPVQGASSANSCNTWTAVLANPGITWLQRQVGVS